MTLDDDLSGDAVADRLALLQTMDPGQIARVVAAQPEVAAALAGKGLLVGSLPRMPKDGLASLVQLATMLGHPATIRVALQGLAPSALRLLTTCWVHGGQLDESDARTEAPMLDDAARERLRAALTERLLIDPTRGYVAPRPGVMAHVELPGRSMRELAESTVVTSDLILERLKRLGVEEPPTRKLERVRLLVDLLRDPGIVDAIVRAMDPTTRDLLRRLGPYETPLDRYGTNGYVLDQMRYQARFERFAQAVGRLPPAAIAMHELESLGFIGIDHEHRCWVWLEVWIALTGRVFTAIGAPPRATVVALAAHGPETPAVVGQLQTVLAQISAEPLAGLKTGGVGVKVARDLAKRIGQPARTTELLVGIARRLQLVEERSEIVGRGRSASYKYTYGTSPSVAAWAERPALDRWALMIDVWLHGGETHDQSGVYAALNRRQAVGDLLALPPGTGLVEQGAADWFRESHVVAAHVDTEALWEDFRVLGLVPTSGPLGLTDLARALLVDPVAAHDLVAESVDHFVVQPDHSVVAPPNIEANIRARLERIAVLHSTGSALVYRLDDVRIGQDIAAGETADAICAFLARHSTVAVSAAVEQFVRDVERRRGGLTVSAAATVITADDTLGLAEAIKVKAARLTLIAPTVAVSDLPPAKVLAALRAKGLAPRSIAPASSSAPPQASVRSLDTRASAPAPLVLHPGLEQLQAKLVRS